MGGLRKLSHGQIAAGNGISVRPTAGAAVSRNSGDIELVQKPVRSGVPPLPVAVIKGVMSKWS